MGLGQATDLLKQLQQQLQNPAFAQQSMQGLQGAGLGAVNPRQFFSTPFDEQVLRQSVLGRVLGYYGSPQIGSVGNPYGLIGGRYPTDPYSGGMGQDMARFAQAGFGDKASWKAAGKPDGGGQMGIMPFLPSGGNPISDAGGGATRLGGAFSGQGGMDSRMGQLFGSPDGFQIMPQGLEQGGFQINPETTGLRFDNPEFYARMGGYNPNIDALNQDYPTMFSNALQRAMSNSGAFGGGGGNFGGGGFGGFNPNSGFGGGGGFPQLDPTTQGALNQQTKAQLGQINMDFAGQKQDLVNQLFGQGLNASSIAGDLGGKLLYGRDQLQQQAYANQGMQEVELRKALLDAQMKAKAAGGGSINFGGGGFSGGGGGSAFGGGMQDIGNLAMELRNGGGNPNFGNPNFTGRSMAPQDSFNLLQGFSSGTSQVPLNFEQQMQLADMQLKRAQLQQSGQLGFGGLGLQRELGLGSQGLQGQGLSQDFLSQLMGMGLARQQGAAGMTQADLARMQQYLLGQQGIASQLGGQQAQLEAQKRSPWGAIFGGLLGAGSSLLSGMATGGTGLFRP